MLFVFANETTVSTTWSMGFFSGSIPGLGFPLWTLATHLLVGSERLPTTRMSPTLFSGAESRPKGPSMASSRIKGATSTVDTSHALP